MKPLDPNEFANINAANLPTLSHDWKADLNKHAELVQRCGEIAAEQVKLVDQNRLAMLGYTNHTQDVLEVDFKTLGKQQVETRRYMHEIETRVLTHVPADIVEAEMLLGFISNSLAVGHEIDADYLSEVILTCLEVREDMLKTSQFG